MFNKIATPIFLESIIKKNNRYTNNIIQQLYENNKLYYDLIYNINDILEYNCKCKNTQGIFINNEYIYFFKINNTNDLLQNLYFAMNKFINEKEKEKDNTILNDFDNKNDISYDVLQNEIMTTQMTIHISIKLKKIPNANYIIPIQFLNLEPNIYQQINIDIQNSNNNLQQLMQNIKEIQINEKFIYFENIIKEFANNFNCHFFTINEDGYSLLIVFLLKTSCLEESIITIYLKLVGQLLSNEDENDLEIYDIKFDSKCNIVICLSDEDVYVLDFFITNDVCKHYNLHNFTEKQILSSLLEKLNKIKQDEIEKQILYYEINNADGDL